MANRSIARMGLDEAVVRLFAARKIHNAKDALGLTEMELMELLDMPMDSFEAALARINKSVCPPFKTVLSIVQMRSKNEVAMGHLSTTLKLLDDALCGGIPSGVITELVGPPGIGKTQLCLTLSIQTVIPTSFGGLGGSVVYIDTERKFSTTRVMQIGSHKYPGIFCNEASVREIAQRMMILTPTSAPELVESLQKLQSIIPEGNVKLLVIDSIATLLEGDKEDEIFERQELLGKQASLLKYLAESCRLPVVVTNHVRASGTYEGYGDGESELWVALGTAWAHAVNIRLVLEVREAKCPVSPAIAMPFLVTSYGIEIDGNEFWQVNEQDLMAVYRNYDGDDDEEIIRFNWWKLLDLSLLPLTN
ncbi:DNA repair protein RAD51 homolog 2-like isoform X2 [Selaginella moellendorffii]|uniref:DNA repair protein RAD51 homolog 2-like isoform X2 n=1 Tax=Selaginella moellendorffii TaxID=88036 RepID=UPI000D1C2E27|nr:DNA repair protein RAD51 homolog 2-like isoform X2 [Selaginella moellendorffii]|eukprot:XP_024530341.1 DNA repair protein RAD51 homolog 2-like isoform X2 [Selaginella moellendorffii]